MTPQESVIEADYINNKAKRNPILLYIISFIIIVVVVQHYYPRMKSIFTTEQQELLENKISGAEDYYNKAKAYALSMPLLDDTIVTVISDSLLVTMIDLNYTWVMYVGSQDGFEEYTEDIESLNNKMDELRVEYETVKAIRGIQRNLYQNQLRQKKKNNKSV